MTQTKEFKLPTLVRHNLHNRDNSIKASKYSTSVKGIKAIGTKNYFGHSRNLPNSKHGYMVSKSSINLNKL